jgi:hypothetical protein
MFRNLFLFALRFSFWFPLVRAERKVVLNERNVVLTERNVVLTKRNSLALLVHNFPGLQIKASMLCSILNKSRLTDVGKNKGVQDEQKNQ